MLDEQAQSKSNGSGGGGGGGGAASLSKDAKGGDSKVGDPNSNLTLALTQRGVFIFTPTLLYSNPN